MRRKTVLSERGNILKTKYFFGSYEKTIFATGKEYEYHFLPGNALMVIADKQANMYYLHKDHLGSILSVSNQLGNKVAEQSFGAWGRQRNVATWTYNNAAPPETLRLILNDRGYTGHEMLPEFKLINMNGRLYDPILARMLSPDNYIQMPDFTQNFNRYSYVLNNPLVYTDPSGEFAFIDDLIVMAVGGLINLGVNAIQGNIHSWGEAGGYFVSGAAAAELTIYAGPIAGGALLGAGNDLTAQLGQKYRGEIDNISWGQTTFSAFMGGATAYVGGVFSNYASPYVSGLTSKIASPVIREALTQGVTNAASGFALGTGVSLINGKDWQSALAEGGKNALFGFGMGTISGTVSGYKYAIDNKIHPWNGKSLSYGKTIQQQYDFAPDPHGDNITMYRGTTGSEGKGGSLFMTDNPNYAASYVKNGGML